MDGDPGAVREPAGSMWRTERIRGWTRGNLRHAIVVQQHSAQSLQQWKSVQAADVIVRKVNRIKLILKHTEKEREGGEGEGVSKRFYSTLFQLSVLQKLTSVAPRFSIRLILFPMWM